MSETKTILNNWIRESKTAAELHEFYISGYIESPECYIDMFDIIRHTGANDIVKIYLNSFGGDLFTAIQFLRVLSECRAEVIVSVEGACMSAATILLLVADTVEVTPHSSIMFHDYSGGAIGKGGDIHRQISHERNWSENLFRKVYAGFLEDKEIQAMLDGKEIWMDSDEVISRLEERAELHALDQATKPD